MTLTAALTHPDLHYAPLTSAELDMVAADQALTHQAIAALDSGDSELVDALMEEKHALERRFQALRAHTWHRWMESEFPAAMVEYAGRGSA